MSGGATLPAVGHAVEGIRDVNAEFSTVVEHYVKEAGKRTGGAFVIHDDELDKDWRLTLVQIHRNRFVSLGDNRYVACVGFIEVKAPKKGLDKSSLDLDIYAKKANGEWMVEDVLIHKVNGQPRYTYDRYNQRMPVMH